MGTKKKRIDVVYSTNPDFEYEFDKEAEESTLAKEAQKLRVSLDKKQRKGKVVTLITGFVGTEEDCQDLAKRLKAKCGVGGSVKDQEILIQGNQKDKIKNILTEEGYGSVKLI